MKSQNKNRKKVFSRKKYNGIKKVSEDRRKLKKAAKKNPRRRNPKDPGVPNGLPFEEEILCDVESRKQRRIDLKKAQKEARKKIHNENRGLTELAVDDLRRCNKFQKSKAPEVATSEQQLKERNPSCKSYLKELKKVIEEADVILEVLDARDPLGSRCPEIEESVITSCKKLVLVLNKIDLIPKKNLEEWLKYLRQSLPTVAFKASTQVQNSNLSRSKTAAIHMNESLQSASCCVGASFLMKVLGNYCRNQNIQTFIKVGVVGFPNVGKSSIINSLKRAKACTVGATPGVTKIAQEISLDKHIKLIDTPGVVFAKSGAPSTLALRNAVKIELLKDVFTPAEAIVKRANHTALCEHYKIPEFSSCHELFGLMAKRMGKFKRGGIPNFEEGARRLINDWNRGYIKYYTHPPEIYNPEVYLSTTIVSEMSKAFDINAMEEQMELAEAPELFPGRGVQVLPSGPTSGKILEDEEENMETDASSSVTVNFQGKKNKRAADYDYGCKVMLEEQQQNKTLKKKFKQMKKNKKRLSKAASNLADSMTESLTL